MKNILLLTLSLVIISCQKENIKTSPRNGRYLLSCVVSANDPSDTLIRTDTINDKFELIIGEKNELNGNFATSFLLNSQLLHHFEITNSVSSGNNYDGISSRQYYYNRNRAFEIATLFVNGTPIPSYSPFYLQVVDFPFKGWNRFTLVQP